ncbi:SPOR domain-containing protein [Azoarcus sp. L1K30]|uniref:SPOR domain-containing protein n=1 Tax=Azoarcus sp. L1K30 TaxID=2820277 RepID=UPI001B836B12|nr:SPOR domain-containing protein [Azoarcus sp. L1K30]MBR0567946.1 SPOR domain-containing protein [Azoarcus sp. L1K30]
MSIDEGVLRIRALRRAGIAVFGAVVLLFGVLVFEDGERAPRPSALAPAQSGPVQQPVVPAPVAVVPEPVPPAPEPAVQAPALVADAPVLAAPEPVAPATAPVAAKDGGAAREAMRKPSPPLANGYLVQLGVFSAMDNAEDLRADVAERGLPAHVEGRVVVGPFASKAAAEAAQARLKREGLSAGIVVPPRKTK